MRWPVEINDQQILFQLSKRNRKRTNFARPLNEEVTVLSHQLSLTVRAESHTRTGSAVCTLRARGNLSSNASSQPRTSITHHLYGRSCAVRAKIEKFHQVQNARARRPLACDKTTFWPRACARLRPIAMHARAARRTALICGAALQGPLLLITKPSLWLINRRH